MTDIPNLALELSTVPWAMYSGGTSIVGSRGGVVSDLLRQSGVSIANAKPSPKFLSPSLSTDLGNTTERHWGEIYCGHSTGSAMVDTVVLLRAYGDLSAEFAAAAARS